MDRESTSSDDSYSAQDEIQTLEEVTAISVTSSSDSSSTTSTVPKTARDKFFTNFQNDMEKKRCSAECLLCETPKRIVDKLGVTSNFTRHARESHKQAFDAWVLELNQWKSSNSKTSTNKITNHFSKIGRSPKKSKYNDHHPRQVELSMAVVNDLIIKLALPLSIVERPAFINFMHTMDPKFVLTSRRTLTRKTIPRLYEERHDRLKMFCSSATSLSLALDVWSDRRLRSFFAVTAHAIVDGVFKSYVLDFVPLWGSHSGALLLQTYEDIVQRFDIKHKVIRLVTDSSSNNITAFKDLIIPGFENYFIRNDDDELTEEDINVDVDDGMYSDEYDDPNELAASTSTTVESTNDDPIESSFRHFFDDNQVFRIPCFAHTIQLVVKDGLKEAKSFLASLEKVSSIAKLSHTIQ